MTPRKILPIEVGFFRFRGIKFIEGFKEGRLARFVLADKAGYPVDRDSVESSTHLKFSTLAFTSCIRLLLYDGPRAARCLFLGLSPFYTEDDRKKFRTPL